MKRAWVLVVVVVSACAGGSPPPPASPATPAASPAPMPGETSCEQAVSRMMDTLAAGKTDVPPDQVKKFHDLFVSHCTTDAWSAQVRQCFGSIKTLDDGDKCGQMLTDAQREALDKATTPENAAGPPPPPAAEPASAPSPSAPATGGTRSPSPKPGKSGDPCDGGN